MSSSFTGDELFLLGLKYCRGAEEESWRSKIRDAFSSALGRREFLGKAKLPDVANE